VTHVYWDTMIFVYWLENHPIYAPRANHIFRTIQIRGDRLCASYLSLGETMAGPLKVNDHWRAAKIQEFFDSGIVELLPFDRKSAGEFARLRASTNIAPADAIHLACASAAGIDLFLTHDTSLKKLKVPGIHFIAGLDVNVF
jgi:predicted nucleic acid-binding protein